MITNKYFDNGNIANMDIIYWPVRSSSWRGGDGVKGMGKG